MLIINNIKTLSSRHNTWQVFNDFCEVSAIAIANSISRGEDWDKREKTYMNIIKRYNRDELDLFSTMLGQLVLISHKNWINQDYKDTLGDIHHDLELHNRYKGQFFTPMNICEAMAAMTLTNIDEVIKDKGYIRICEPACGSGAIILGVANVLVKRGYEPNKVMRVVATDVDIKCVHMCYLQLTLYGIPAVVVHGNTLTLEEWSKWYTPLYIPQGCNEVTI